MRLTLTVAAAAAATLTVEIPCSLDVVLDGRSHQIRFDASTPGAVAARSVEDMQASSNTTGELDQPSFMALQAKLLERGATCLAESDATRDATSATSARSPRRARRAPARAHGDG